MKWSSSVCSATSSTVWLSLPRYYSSCTWRVCYPTHPLGSVHLGTPYLTLAMSTTGSEFLLVTPVNHTSVFPLGLNSNRVVWTLNHYHWILLWNIHWPWEGIICFCRLTYESCNVHLGSHCVGTMNEALLLQVTMCACTLRMRACGVIIVQKK
jgi:hypothetical protein